MYTDEVVGLYDLEHAGFDADEHLYLSYALMTGGPVLELGCGSGRLLLPLARAGYEVWGVDSSPAMLRAARARLDGAGLRGVRLVETALWELGALPSGRFGLAYCALNTWAHLHDSADALRALEAVHRALRPAGLLVLDLEDPERRSPGRGELLLAGVFADGEDTVTKTVASVYDPASGTDAVTIIWDRVRAGAVHRTVAQATMRAYARLEVGLLLGRAGFSVREEMGSWELEEYPGRGERLIVVAVA